MREAGVSGGCDGEWGCVITEEVVERNEGVLVEVVKRNGSYYSDGLSF